MLPYASYEIPQVWPTTHHQNGKKKKWFSENSNQCDGMAYTIPGFEPDRKYVDGHKGVS